MARLGGRRVAPGFVTSPPVGQPDRFLNVLRAVRIRRIKEAVGQPIVHCCESSPTGICKPGDLDGRGFPCEKGESAVRHMHDRIDQYVDSVATYLRRHVTVTPIEHVVPTVGAASVPICHWVRILHAGIEVNFEILMIVGTQQGQREVRLSLAKKYGETYPSRSRRSGFGTFR